MGRKLKIVSSILVSLLLLAGLALLILIESAGLDVPEPKSDVPIEYKIGWWAYQEALEVTDFKSELIYNSLNLFNSKAVIQYSISGSLKYKQSWRPYIKSVFISERWEETQEGVDGNMADIKIVPVVGVEKDESYRGEGLTFSINVQDYLQAGGWGRNTYNISLQDKVLSIELMQRK